jgi:2-furoate---CoA ligase
VNLALALVGAAERHPDAEALVDGGVRLTYRELAATAARVAGGLARLGVRARTRGDEAADRVAAVLDNRHETVELYWACQWLGATFVPLSWRSADEDVRYCVEDCGARLVATIDGDATAVGDRAFEALMDALPHAPSLELDEGAESLMLYTSGTTGRPKGVPRSHRADRAGGLSQALQHGYLPGDRTLGVMPLYHTMGIHSLLAMPVVGGCFVCLPRWDAARALELIEHERITSLYLAPTLFHDLVSHPALAEHDVSSVRALGYAGSAMTGALVERCAHAFEPEVFVNHYGSTEIYTFSIGPDQRSKPGCAGRPAVNARLRLDESGEILCHLGSDEAFAGYWNRPDADAKAIDGDWYRTGDVGRLDEDGDLWVEGRVDDMIISGGENIHPLEVEDVLARHANVREVAVVGEADERLGQRVVAFVVASDAVGADELDALCLASTALARFKRPREYRFVDELPKSPSGKILRRMLREGQPA